MGTVSLLASAGCSSSDDKAKPDVVSVSGKFGQKPKVVLPESRKSPHDLSVKTLVSGSGRKVGKNDYVRLDYYAQAIQDGRLLGSTWLEGKTRSGQPRSQLVGRLTGAQPILPPKVAAALVGKTVGSRIEVQGPSTKISGQRGTASMDPKDGQVWVIDVVNSVHVTAKPQREVKAVAPEPGMPSVQSKAGAPAAIKIPSGQKYPEKLRVQRLVAGHGPGIKAGDALVAHYTAQQWSGKLLGSSWKQGGPVAFQIGTGAVMKGIENGLVGKNVGDRLALVIPPGLAGGPQQDGKKDALVIVVDLLARL